MTISTFAGTPVIGVNFSARRLVTPDDPADHALGTFVRGLNGESWVFVVASGTVAAGTCSVAVVAGTYVVTDAAGDYTAVTPFADGETGWVYLTASVPADT